MAWKVVDAYGRVRGAPASTGWSVVASDGAARTVTDILVLREIADPGYANANEVWLHAEDVAGITQIHHNTSGHKWTIGQDNWIVVRNVTGSTIPALRAVYVSGSTGTRPQVTMADADLHNHALGVTQDSMANNAYGAVVISGFVKGVDTSGWVAGDALYVGSTAGVLTTTVPTFPAAKQRVATVIYSHATQGIIQVFHHEDVREGDGTWETPFSIGDGTTAGELRLLEPSGTQYTAIKAQAQAANVTYTLPAADAAGALTSNGSGTLSWASASGGFSAPQGRLTLTTATPVMVAEAAAQTTLYYALYVGDKIPLYNGTSWTMTTFTELSIAMAGSANWATDKNFDVFVYSDGGTLRLVTGAAWTNDTTRSEALVRTNGIWLNNASFTGRYGASSTVAIDASRATYVGTIRTSAAGTTTWELGGTAAGGDPVLLYVWNCYNRVRVGAVIIDSTASWTYNSATIRSKNASNSNRATFVRGLNEDAVRADQFISGNTSTASDYSIGFGLDSTSSMVNYPAYTATANAAAVAYIHDDYEGMPGLGLHYLQAVEEQRTTLAAATVYGSTSKMHFSGMF